ncbi:MAG: type II toxin-antitoxin system HicA family toxin [bacterium]
MQRMIPTNWETQVKVFERFGCIFKRQKGSHLIFRFSGAKRPVVIPKHKEVSVSIIKANMKTVAMTQEKYFELINEIQKRKSTLIVRGVKSGIYRLPETTRLINRDFKRHKET